MEVERLEDDGPWIRMAFDDLVVNIRTPISGFGGRGLSRSGWRRNRRRPTLTAALPRDWLMPLAVSCLDVVEYRTVLYLHTSRILAGSFSLSFAAATATLYMFSTFMKAWVLIQRQKVKTGHRIITA